MKPEKKQNPDNYLVKLVVSHCFAYHLQNTVNLYVLDIEEILYN